MVIAEETLKPNTKLKPKDWYMRNSWAIRGMPFPNQGWMEGGRLRTSIESPNYEVVVSGKDTIPIVRCKTFKFTDRAPEIEDGAIVAVRAGGLTPPQYVESETEFHEIPLRGKLIFLCISPEGQFRSYVFNVSERDDSTILAQVSKGWVMRWYACKEGQRIMRGFFEEDFGSEDALVLETETPGFSLAKLPTIPDDASRIGNTKIPPEFWNACHLLEAGSENIVIANSVDVSKLNTSK